MSLSGRLHRNLYGKVEASQIGSLTKDISASRKKLIDQGVSRLIASLVRDLQDPQLPQQLRALHAIGNLTGNKIGVAALQKEFNEHSGLQPLIDIVNLHSKDSSGESEVASCRAIEALFQLTRNNAASRQAALAGGALEAVMGILGDGKEVPVTVASLRLLHNLVAGPATGESARRLFALNGITSLVNLLELLVGVTEGDDVRDLWLKDVLSVLEPCASHCKQAAAYISQHTRILCQILCTCQDPLCLSLTLDILEEVVSHSKQEERRLHLAQQGLMGALIYAIGFRGLGGQAATVLANLCSGDPSLMPALQAFLQPHDLATLVHTAALGGEAGDVEAQNSEAFLAELLQCCPSSTSSQVLYCPKTFCSLMLAGCVAQCLKMARVKGHLLNSAASQIGSVALRNLTMHHSKALSVSLAQLLPYDLEILPVLNHPVLVSALVAAFLEEQMGASADKPATHGVINVLQACPDDRQQQESSSLDAVEQPVPEEMVNAPSEAANSDVAFQIAGREILAPGWIMEQASAAIARTLSHVPDAANAAVVIPSIQGVSSDRLFLLFGIAVEYAVSRRLKVEPRDVLDLWALAAVLQMEQLLVKCGNLLQRNLAAKTIALSDIWPLTQQYPAGVNLVHICLQHIAQQLSEGEESIPGIEVTVHQNPSQVQVGLQLLLSGRIKLNLRHAHNGDANPDLMPQCQVTVQTPNSVRSADLLHSHKVSFSDWGRSPVVSSNGDS